MFADLAFFSFIELTDPTVHREYNEWHQLDHLPENRALPGVAWGDRWAHRGELKELGSAAEEFAGVDYAAMYWFRAPVDPALDAWDRLGEATFQLGRGPLIPGVRRALLAFFRPVEGQAARRIGVGPEVLPFRPNRGVYLTASRYQQHRSLDAHERFRWESQELIPALLDLDGVAGAWTFTFDHAQRHSTLPFTYEDPTPFGGLRIRLVYIDGDPVETARGIASQTTHLNATADPAARAAENVVFAGPLSTIIPWRDW